jgi:hypothetical protein
MEWIATVGSCDHGNWRFVEAPNQLAPTAGWVRRLLRRKT